jgi:disulfide oxidoreductase YuzD
VVVSTVNVPAFNDQYLFLDAAIEAKYPLNDV